MTIAKDLLVILARPKCHQPVELNPQETGLLCNSCKLLYRIEDDIPIMLIDEAEPLES